MKETDKKFKITLSLGHVINISLNIIKKTNYMGKKTKDEIIFRGVQRGSNHIVFDLIYADRHIWQYRQTIENN